MSLRDNKCRSGIIPVSWRQMQFTLNSLGPLKTHTSQILMKNTSQTNRFIFWMIALFLSFASSLLADETYAPPTYRGKVILVVDKTVAADPQVGCKIARLRR